MPNPNLREFYDRYIAALNARDFDVMKDFIHDEVTSNSSARSRLARRSRSSSTRCTRSSTAGSNIWRRFTTPKKSRSS